MQTIEDEHDDVLRSDPNDWRLHHLHFTASKAAALAALSDHTPARTRQEIISEYKKFHNSAAPAPATGIKAEGWHRQPTSVKHFLILTHRLALDRKDEPIDRLIDVEFWIVGRLTYTGAMPTAGIDRLQDRSVFWEERNRLWKDVLKSYTPQTAWMSASPPGANCSFNPLSTPRHLVCS